MIEAAGRFTGECKLDESLFLLGKTTPFVKIYARFSGSWIIPFPGAFPFTCMANSGISAGNGPHIRRRDRVGLAPTSLLRNYDNLKIQIQSQEYYAATRFCHRCSWKIQLA